MTGWFQKQANAPPGLRTRSTSGTASSGSHGLAVDVSGTGYPAVGVDTGLAGVGPGTPVSYRVWAPAGVSAAVAPMVFDGSWNVTVLANQPLSPGWNTVSFAVPSGLSGLRILGLQVDDDGGWAGRLVLDSVAY